MARYTSKQWDYSEAWAKSHFLEIGDIVVFNELDSLPNDNYKKTKEEVEFHLNNLYTYEVEGDVFTITGFKEHNKNGNFQDTKQRLLIRLETAQYADAYNLLNDFKFLIRLAENSYAGGALENIEDLITSEKNFKAGRTLMLEHVEIMN